MAIWCVGLFVADDHPHHDCEHRQAGCEVEDQDVEHGIERPKAQDEDRDQINCYVTHHAKDEPGNADRPEMQHSDCRDDQAEGCRSQV